MRGRLALVRSLLRGDPANASGSTIVLVVVTLGGLASVVANVVGAIVVFVLLVFVLPTPDGLDTARTVTLNLVAAGIYLGASLLLGAFGGIRHTTRSLRWLRDDREPLDGERDQVLRLALRITLRQAAYWLVAVVVFTLLNLPASGILALEVGITVFVGGAVTASVTYLLQRRVGRPAVARALESVPPGAFRVPGVALRTVVTWGLGTALPVAGVAMLAGASLVLGDVDGGQLALAAFVLSLTALGAGLLTMLVYAKSIADPLRAMRDAVREMEGGDFAVRVPVYDASEVGFLQASLNRMAAGLQERERMRDLFGRHVGQDVAARALADGGVELGGEERHVGVLFVDVVGSTSFTAAHRPTEVVDALNAFFAVVVAVTRDHGGLVNKFEGDAALCVWGAPLSCDDPAGAALAAARDLARRLVDAEQLPAAIGVSAGTVVAGNVGAEDRLEYTVIGDPVNEAARLTELAKALPGRVLASWAAVEAAVPGEAACWQDAGVEPLRGRDEPVPVATPR